MNWHEVPLVFDCEGSRLMGIITRPERPHHTAVVIVVGGPQYRAGSHRQFTLLARQLAEQGIAAIRFDYRGMGDSEGAMRNFENIDADIKSAVDALMAQVPEIERIALWGLCDGASATLYYSQADARVKGLMLLNPWVHSETGAARARLKYYYLDRLLSLSFWTKLLGGKVKLNASLSDLTHAARQAREPEEAALTLATSRQGTVGYIERMLTALKKYTASVHIILSGKDLTAQEFRTLLQNNKSWHAACNRKQNKVTMLKDANHTFSQEAWRKQVETHTVNWIYREMS